MSVTASLDVRQAVDAFETSAAAEMMAYPVRRLLADAQPDDAPLRAVRAIADLADDLPAAELLAPVKRAAVDLLALLDEAYGVVSDSLHTDNPAEAMTAKLLRDLERQARAIGRAIADLRDACEA